MKDWENSTPLLAEGPGPIVVGPASVVTPNKNNRHDSKRDDVMSGKNDQTYEGDDDDFHGSQDCCFGTGRFCCRFKICPKRNSVRWMTCCGVAACVTLIMAFVMPAIIDAIIEDELGKELIVTSSKDAGYEDFASDSQSSIETFEKIYFFNVENEAEVLQGAKPVLVERGPYVYRKWEDRFAGVPGAYTGPEFVSDGREVSYYRLRRWDFIPEMSCGGCTEDDAILGPDWVLNGFRYYITYLKSLLPATLPSKAQSALGTVLDGLMKAVMCTASTYTHPRTGEPMYTRPDTPFWKRPVTDILFGFNFAPHLNVTNKFLNLIAPGLLFLDERNPGPKERHRCDNYPGDGQDWTESGFTRSSSTCFDDAFTQSGKFREKTGKNKRQDQGEYISWPGGRQTNICANPNDCVLCLQLNNMGRHDIGSQRLECPDFQDEWNFLPIRGPRTYRFPWSQSVGVLEEGQTIEVECPEDSTTCFTLEDFAGFKQPYVTGTGSDSYANRVFGSDGTLAGLGFDSDKFYVFNGELPGVIVLDKDTDDATKEGELKGVPYTRYKFGNEQYETCNTEVDPGSVQCQRGNTGPNGVINGDLPNEIYLFLSQPHFLNADPDFVESLVGMNPLEAAHATRVDINDFTGRSIRGKQSTQLGIKVFNYAVPPPPEVGVLSCLLGNECLAGLRDITPDQIANKEGLGLCFLDPANGCITFDENGNIDLGAAINCLTNTCASYITNVRQFTLCAGVALTSPDPVTELLVCITEYGLFLPGVKEALVCTTSPTGACTASLQATLALEDPLTDVVNDVAQVLTVALPNLIGVNVSEAWMSQCVAWDGQWTINSKVTDLTLGTALFIPAFWDDYEIVLPDDYADDLNYLYDQLQLRDDLQLSLLVISGAFGFSLLTMLWLHRLNMQETGKAPATGWFAPAEV